HRDVRRLWPVRTGNDQRREMPRFDEGGNLDLVVHPEVNGRVHLCHWLSQNLSYAALSIRPDSWPLSASFSFTNQPAPSGSSLTLAGSSTIAPFASTTSPDAGA